MNNFSNIKIGDAISYNYYGESFSGIVTAKRELSVGRTPTFSVSTDKGHIVYIDYIGNGTQYNDYSTAIVKCDDNKDTRAAFEQIKVIVDEETFKSMIATIRCANKE